MKLLLDPLDLKAEHRNGEDQDIPTSSVKFEHLTAEAQQAVRVVGKGKFETWRKDNYNMVFAPK